MILIDAIVLKVHANAGSSSGVATVGNRPVYVAMGINIDGEREILGMWVGPTGGEGAKQWMNMLTELRNRGLLDACIVCCDRLRPARRDHRDLAASILADLRGSHGRQHVAVRVDEELADR